MLDLFVRYNLRSLRVRRWGTTATLMGVGLVAAVFCHLLSLADAMCHALQITGDPRNIIVLAEGATAESNSSVSHEETARLATTPHIAADSSGRPLVSPEVVVQLSLRRNGDRSGAYASVVVRGMERQVGLGVRPAARIVSGRWFEAGHDELVVGQTAAQQFEVGAIGSTIECGNRQFTLVGVFQAGGGAHESELWGHVHNIAAAYHRERYSSAIVRVDALGEASIDEATKRIASAGVALCGISAPRYYANQTQNAQIVRGLALLIVVVMGIGAVFAGTNAAHASVGGRVGEIGMLRAVGFTSRMIMFGLLGESACVAVAGGILGCAASALFILFGGATRDLVGTMTFTSVAFTMHTSAAAVAQSLCVAIVIGVLGAVWPARRVAKMPVIRTLLTA